jgi:haloacid dehalogenase-like hydrolase
VLAIAAGPPGRPALLGLVALADPVRPEARAAVLAARAAGIRPIMITGDHPSTAAAVAARTGVTDTADPPTAPQVPLRTVYARIDPAEKLGIVTAWQRAGHVVAMTGDGVNDAPALRAADVGVAMGVRGTEVAKQAADVVLTEDSLGTIVAAVAEGRRVFDNVRWFVRYGVAGGLAELIVMLAGPFLGLALPLLPAQILWVNLLTHGAARCRVRRRAGRARRAQPSATSAVGRGAEQAGLVGGGDTRDSDRGELSAARLLARRPPPALADAAVLCPRDGSTRRGAHGALGGASGLAHPAERQPLSVRRGGRKRARHRRGRLGPAARRAARHGATVRLRPCVGACGRVCPRRGRRAHEGATTPRGEETA